MNTPREALEESILYTDRNVAALLRRIEELEKKVADLSGVRSQEKENVYAINPDFNFQETFNRAKLRGYAEEMRKAAEVAKQARLRNAVRARVDAVTKFIKEAAMLDKTVYVYDPRETHWAIITGRQTHRNEDMTINDLLTGLQEKFPDCTVTLCEEWVDVVSEHRRGQPPTRVLKSGIKIDWS